MLTPHLLTSHRETYPVSPTCVGALTSTAELAEIRRSPLRPQRLCGERLALCPRQHDYGRPPNITRLIYYEETPDVKAAIARKKQIKGWLRAKKIALIESVNAEWKDLSDEWGED